MKLHKGDEIIITGGKDKGRKGKIERVLTKEQKVLVLGVNLYKRHLKKQNEKNPGGIVDFPRPLPTGRVAIICPKCKKPTRVGWSSVKGEKHRICRKCKQLI
ncbi:MAG: 50S ribosomal protein L24 [Candidatus Gottesmanbacteria bacterium GW2011_GWB1_43_11]|uniref:Large ribosomal subunit protein uL24 n=1 Tax=Candidatus Gottesmanbacteria bacterium GW2011_GWB1_43_11 TaxID=1618446 RepID=A0A0G1FJ39_9BACT|nr:MAG: 50S ribosomal protein L24 [Candidatus Gottesmanbacteria bacterium GW2011_GWA2_42_16]KKS55746.1 MAG: 50S ribosomal protein L24 [Candidatus Gottesmanbacteria bacterium GW2011_GWA1_42_26]KKS81948.1 MAG: 50S ribosomal protein L24 [Candidatus Gottesmanbacteria bacterium GW2011_GWC1_43_10]KKS86868.1 MAG: 50S ribosomal protein L24 [Candidatus Gottesmanbacteria bacterium GW2011_GWB1_43_11]OGG10480.1 MAG: 50S ribosomal protein L24 [Candidatus Gottesmanbacteria bacterium RIFCSPHIGHO2_01_FULL_43_1